MSLFTFLVEKGPAFYLTSSILPVFQVYTRTVSRQHKTLPWLGLHATLFKLSKWLSISFTNTDVDGHLLSI